MSYTEYPTMERCPLHDVIIDDETGTCDLCTAEDCPKCQGDGVINHIHPDWGKARCPDPFVETACGYCAGTGLKDGGL